MLAPEATVRREAIGVRRWRSTPRPALAGWQKSWLTRGGSLTQRLSTLGNVEVRVVRETVGMPWADERRCVTPGLRGRVWIREVVLLVDGVPCVAAHSIAPLSASRGVWRAMRALGSRPLADLLFIDRSVSRSPLVSRRVGVGVPLYRFARGFAPALSTPLMARRSLFVRRGAPLLVTECMLPTLWAAASESVAAARPDRAPRRRPARRAGAAASCTVPTTSRPRLGP